MATARGGKDGRSLFDAVLRAAREAGPDEFDCLLIGGPLLSDGDRAELDSLAAERPNLHLLDATSDLISYLAAADAVVSMGGYNVVCEILTLNQRAIIVPRTTPRKEQLLRATFLSKRGPRSTSSS